MKRIIVVLTFFMEVKAYGHLHSSVLFLGLYDSI